MSDPSSSSTIPKAIGSLAKKQSDVTRQGTQKLKFAPTLPQQRKKPDIKAEPSTNIIPLRGRGRGQGSLRGKGRGRFEASAIEMTASGPFAMGPALSAGSTSRKSVANSSFPRGAPLVAPLRTSEYDQLAGIPTLRGTQIKTEENSYSDAEEGIEIVDMENVRQLDWMAPDVLRQEHLRTKKVEASDDSFSPGMENRKNALYLKDPEEGEELEEIIEDFLTQTGVAFDKSDRKERMYFFQFPAPFPEFCSKNVTTIQNNQNSVAMKKVSFSGDVKGDDSATSPSEVPSLDGVIGQLEVYKSGTVKIRLVNGILLDVGAATQPSFLQQAVHLNNSNSNISVLGEVNKQFVISPNIDVLLAALGD